MTDTTFKQAYGTLKRHSETLRTQSEPDIDNLLTIVTESVSAYQVCKARIDAVEKALEQALGGTGAEVQPGGTAKTAPSRFEDPFPTGQTGQTNQSGEMGDAGDDDVPF